MNAPPKEPALRLASIDAYRGFVMLLMMAEVLHLARIAKALPDSGVWAWLGWHQSHVPWAGCSLHDLIQPSFSFLVGVAVPFSLAARLKRGDSIQKAMLHAAWRAFALIVLGVFLRSIGKPQTNFTFEDTLSQIGLGYLPLFLLGLAPRKVWWLALVILLIGYWGAFALYPVPGESFDYPAVGVPADWPHHYQGFAAHWNKNSNLAWAFDHGFLNLFPRAEPFTHNRGGYSTLSFLPTLATMILGLIAGGWLRDDISPAARLRRLLIAGVAGLSLGWLLDATGICPSVKRIWTPAWTMFSGGWSFLLLTLFYAVIDVAGWRAWSFPLRVIGQNSIAAYLIAHLFEGFIVEAFKTHLGPDVFQRLGTVYEPVLAGAAVLTIYWLILYWMYRRGLFLRI